MARTLLLLGFCSVALAQTPATPNGIDWRFAHPDADMRASVNLQAILNSPAIAKAIEQGKAQAKDNAAQIDLALAMLRTVDRISVSVRQKTDLKTISQPAPGKAVTSDVDVLAQVTGSFDPQLITGFFPSTGTSKVKVVGPHTLLIGEGDSFAKAAGRMAGAGAPIARDEMEQSDVWISASAGFLSQQANQQAMPFPAMRGLSLGLNFGEAPEINVLLTAADEAGASQMLKTIQLALGQLTQAAPMAGAAAKALSLKQDGSKLRLHFVAPPEMVALAQQQVALGGLPAQLAPLLGSFGVGGFGATTPAKQPSGATPPPPPPQSGGKIMIYGLDGGPREIPVQR